ncbi:MAG: DNA-directed RNA polymerase subunit alpha, partial [Thermoguttaceae bacterium]|nr:DNA-directed RNA polymerase subunit alpha [Thermoguttaceae bacterium]
MGTRIKLNPEVVREAERQRKLAMSTAEIGLSVRTTNCLDEQGISTVEDLLNCNP